MSLAADSTPSGNSCQGYYLRESLLAIVGGVSDGGDGNCDCGGCGNSCAGDGGGDTSYGCDGCG